MPTATIHDLRPLGNGHVLAFDLIDVLRLFEPAAELSVWRCSDVGATGDATDELQRASADGIAITGPDLFRLAAAVDQVIDGAFAAIRAEGDPPWLIVRAVDSSFYAVTVADHNLLARVRATFRDVRDVPDGGWPDQV